MIQAYVGVPGGGKTYWGIETAMNYIASGGVVVSNIRFAGTVETGEPWPRKYVLADDSPVSYYLYDNRKWVYQNGQYLFLDYEAFMGDWVSMIPKGTKEKHVLLLLDEVSDIFDSLDKGRLNDKNGSYRKMFEFLRLHRHYYVDCVFLLQDFSTLNARLRGLCEYVSKTVDLQGKMLAGIPIKCFIPLFARFTYERSGRILLKTKYVNKDPAVFALYESYCEHGNIALCEAGKTDFRGAGTVEKKKVSV